MSADLTNAIFEIGGGFLMWLNTHTNFMKGKRNVRFNS